MCMIPSVKESSLLSQIDIESYRHVVERIFKDCDRESLLWISTVVHHRLFLKNLIHKPEESDTVFGQLVLDVAKTRVEDLPDSFIDMIHLLSLEKHEFVKRLGCSELTASQMIFMSCWYCCTICLSETTSDFHDVDKNGCSLETTDYRYRTAAFHRICST